ncbi:PorV/PorQ family protein [Melioribacteraceae bacterium 4301-Me]|uniref:PorV/PorQ family protein n=1 Tax=Pyranulibacter aquaticus TaxID=3163344 RepID=UPI0035962411
MRNVYLISFLIMIFILPHSKYFGQSVSKTGTTAAAFLEIPVGASAIGMGGAYVSVVKDASSLYWNPAGAASIENYEAILSHTNWIADTRFDFAGLVIPLSDFGNVGFSFTSFSMDDMKVRTVEKPDGTGEYFSAGDIAVGVSYARNLSDRFSIGFTAKYIQQNIWHMSAQAFAIDAGTKFKTDLFGGMIIGASMYNFGTPMKMTGRDTRYFISVDPTKLGSNDQIPTEIETDSWDLPLTFQIGVSTNLFNSELYRMSIAIDAIHPNNEYESMNFGLEASFKDFLFLRAGYQNAFLKDSEGGLSLGVGINSKLILSNALLKFDYAYRDFGRLENVHTFSLEIAF